MKNKKTLNYLPIQKLVLPTYKSGYIEVSLYYGTVIQNDDDHSQVGKIVMSEKVFKVNKKLENNIKQLEQEFEVAVRNFWEQNPKAMIRLMVDENTILCKEGQLKYTQGTLVLQ